MADSLTELRTFRCPTSLAHKQRLRCTPVSGGHPHVANKNAAQSNDWRLRAVSSGRQARVAPLRCRHEKHTRNTGALSKSPRLSPRASDHIRGVTKMVRMGCQNGTSESYAGSGARRCAAGLACAGFASLSSFWRRSWSCSAMISVTQRSTPCLSSYLRVRRRPSM